MPVPTPSPPPASATSPPTPHHAGPRQPGGRTPVPPLLRTVTHRPRAPTAGPRWPGDRCPHRHHGRRPTTPDPRQPGGRCPLPRPKPCLRRRRYPMLDLSLKLPTTFLGLSMPWSDGIPQRRIRLRHGQPSRLQRCSRARNNTPITRERISGNRSHTIEGACVWCPLRLRQP
jgi:hypothetical protein